MEQLNDFNTDTVEINGPLNVVRLEGKIGDIKKVIYLFMDVHYPLCIQSKCANIFAKDVHKYLAETFEQLDKDKKMVDFFIETFEDSIQIDADKRSEVINKQNNIGKQQIYIFQLIRLVESIVKFDRKSKKIKSLNQFPNLRVHYLDIRDSMRNLSNMIYSFPDITDIRNLRASREIFETLDAIRSAVQSLKEIYDSVKADRNYQSTENPGFSRNIRKVLHDYKNKNVKNIITRILDECFSIFDDIVILCDDSERAFRNNNKILDNPQIHVDGDLLRSGIGIDREINMFVNNTYRVNDLQDLYLLATVGITDCYLLRRFLDKNYITNAVVYTGATHSLNYIRRLMRDFNFKITHVSLKTVDTISELNWIVKQRVKEDKTIAEYFIRTNKAFEQCSNLTDFPKRFN